MATILSIIVDMHPPLQGESLFWFVLGQITAWLL